MENKRFCRSLGRETWWLLAFVGLPIFFLSMFFSEWGPIEEDLQVRTTQELKSAGMDWPKVDVKQRGRDLLLTGIAASDTDRVKAIEIVSGVEGVRVVEDTIKVIPFTSPELSLKSSANGKIILSGVMPSQSSIGTLYKATVDVYKKDNVINKLTTKDRVSSPQWLSSLSSFLPALKGMKNASLTMSDSVQKISGVVHTDAAKATLLAKMRNLLGNDSNASIDDKIIVKPLKKANLLADVKDDKLTIKGVLANQQKIDETIKSLTEHFGAENVVNKLTVSDEYSDKEGAITLTGTLTDQSFFTPTATALKSASDSLGLTLTNNLVFDDSVELAKKAEEERSVTEAKAKTEKKEAERLAAEEKAKAEKAESERLIAEQRACQVSLNAAMEGKTILFRTNKADIREASFPLLKEISTLIQGCQGQVPDSKITISGHTDSVGNDDYNMALSLRRASSVSKYLVTHGVSGPMLTSRGHGETQPIATNATRAGRAQNRRITFSLQ